MQIKSEAFDAIRIAVAKTEALAHAVEQAFDGEIWPPGTAGQALDRLAHLIGATTEAAAAALCAVDALNSALADAAPITSAVEAF